MEPADIVLWYSREAQKRVSVTIKRNLITVSAAQTNNRRAKCPIVIDNMNDGLDGHFATNFLTHGRFATISVRPVMQDPLHYILIFSLA
jgi:hypothetical protein